MPKRVHVFVSGDVQGVGFRWFCREMAMGERLTGFVRNLPDGRVEAAFEGPDAGVDRLVAWCGHGPGAARVDNVDVRPEPLTGELGFAIDH